MCGISGILHFDVSRKVDENGLLKMRDSLQHRGPDGAGFFIDKEIGLAHRRLSIIDISENAKQPFYSPDGRYVMVFNGEIFNYLELRKEFENGGDILKSHSDTEVLLRLYIKYGESCLEKLNGMFAIVIWDSIERTLFVARDRIGVKPFYYTVYNNTFYFASEPKAIFAAGVPKVADPACINELLLFKYVAGENTVFQHVKRLLPGHQMTIKQGAIQIYRWWNLPEKIKANRENLPKNPYTYFEELFYSSVAYRTISDVPVGVMLSGGLDSGSIAAALFHNKENNIAAFNVQFEEKEYNESHLAELVCKKFGLHFHSISLTGNDLYNSIIDATIFHDEPLIHQNDAQMLFLSQHAKKFVTVLLSGEGGDEFMGGYVRYKPLNHHQFLQGAAQIAHVLKKIPSGGIVNRLDKLSRYVKGNSLSALVLLNASNLYPNDFAKWVLPIGLEGMTYRQEVYKEALDLYPTEPARQAMYCDLFIHMASVLDRNDRMTMGAGIECRVPFMDYRLMEMIPALPSSYLLKGKKGKFLLYNSVAQQLPKEVLQFKKLGFSVPWEKYMKEDARFADCIQQIKEGSLREWVGAMDMHKLIDNAAKHNGMERTFVRQLLMLHLWKEHYLENNS